MSAMDSFGHDAVTPSLRAGGARRTSRRRATTAAARPAVSRIAGALLCLAVAAIHVKDQGGLPGHEDPAYLQGLYYALEAGAVATAIALIAPLGRSAWGAALLVAAGPLAGYVLSRGPGLPDAADEKGHWAEPLGIASLAVEALLLVLAVAMLARWRRRRAASLG